MASLLRKRRGLSKKAELKLQIAQESREPVYDLSDCQLVEIPKCVESQVKYFNKTVLILHSNLLHRLCHAGKVANLSHLTYLDLHSNKFQLFPDEVFSMPFLKVLDLSFNELRAIPDRIDELGCIQYLNLEGNCIPRLPPSVGSLLTLEELRIDGNPITHLPVALGYLKQLKPICDYGAPAILAFLREVGQLTEDEIAFTEVNKIFSTTDRCQDYGEGVGWHQVAENFHAHEETACRASGSRAASLKKLMQKEIEMENGLELLRRQREQGRSELVTTLCETTKRIDDLICRLHQKQRVLRKDDQPQSPITHPCETITSHPREGVLDSKNAVLDASRTGSMGYSVIGADDQEEIDSALQCVLISRRADQAQLAVRVAIEDGEQMKAFECLQQQRNLRRQQIVDNIQLVERELCRLSRVERERKAFQNALILGQFSERRRDLVRLLSDLQRQKDQRESELYEFLKGLEEQRERDQTFYWLVQYQRLMDRTPLDLRKNPLLVSSVLSGNENESEPIPNNAGNDRMASPSAPPAVVARFENECCICQDAKCSIIFLPCGHVCCCKFCSVKVVLCPLCRNTVEQHIQIS